MMSILKKELNSLKHFLILILCMGGYIIISNLFLEAQNLSTIDSLIDYFHGDSYFVHVIFYLIFSLSLTSGLIMREYDEKTIDFLSGLPVSLGKVFVIKVVLSTLIISLLPLSTMLYGIVTHIISRHSLISGFYLDVLAAIYLLHLFQILFLVILGTCLSYFRLFSWIMMALIFWVYTLMVNLFPALEVFNVFKIIAIEFSGTKVVIPWKMLLFQTLLGAVLFLISYIIFVDPGKKLYEMYESFRKTAQKKMVLYLITGGAIFLMATVIVKFMFTLYGGTDKPPREVTGELHDEHTKYSVEKQAMGTLKAQSTYYEFEYPLGYETEVNERLFTGDMVYEKLSDFFDYKHEVKVYVDMKGKSRNYAGLAHWQNIYLNFAVVADYSEYMAVLGHETVHVFLENMSDRRLSNDGVSNKYFHEGMAGYLEYSFFRRKEEFDRLREQAAAAYALRPLTFEELVDYNTFRTHYNHMLIYNFGTLFCESIVDLYGREGIRTLLHVLATKEETFKLTGVEKWRSLFQYARLDSEKIFLHFKQKMAGHENTYAETITQLKNMRAAIDTGKKEIRIIPNKQSFLEGWSLMCLVRNSADVPDMDLRTLYLHSDDSFHLRKSSIHRSGFWYQLYLKKKDNTKVLYLPWQEIKL